MCFWGYPSLRPLLASQPLNITQAHIYTYNLMCMYIYSVNVNGKISKASEQRFAHCRLCVLVFAWLFAVFCRTLTASCALCCIVSQRVLHFFIIHSNNILAFFYRIRKVHIVNYCIWKVRLPNIGAGSFKYGGFLCLADIINF